MPPCAWLPYTNREIELTRLRRRIHRLEQRLESMRGYQMAGVYRDAIIALEAKLVELRGRLDRG